MKKFLPLVKLLFTVVLGFSAIRSFAQVANYTFSQSTATYTTVASPTTIFASGWDDGVASVPIPFTFSFNGVGYTSASVNANGYITFGATTSTGTSFTPISANTAYSGAISAFSRDLISNGSTIVFGTEGIAPNRVFVVQWNNARRYNSGAVAGDVLNFQIRLYENSNNAEVKYGTNTATDTSSLPTQVGLRGVTNADYNNRTNTTNWNATGTGATNAATCTTLNTVMPASGLTFTWNVGYCIPTYTNGTVDNDFISRVNIQGTNLNNPSGPSTVPFYTNYPATGNTTATLTAGTSYSLNVTAGTYVNGYISAWIDYNNDGFFSGAEILGQSGNAGNSTQQTIQFTVPANALLTNVRLRLREGYLAPGPANNEACGAANSSFGETEDYTLSIVAPVPCVSGTAATALTSSVTEIGCGINPATITLSTSGGSAGSGGVSTLFYQGNTCPVISYVNEFFNSPSVDATYIGAISNGSRTFTTTSNDPMIHLENVLPGVIADPNKTKFIVIRYKVITNPGANNSFEIYFNKTNFNLDEARVVRQTINTDGNWHIATIDMSSNTQWNNTGGNITGWRFDYATLPGTVIDIDYILLGDTPILENTNVNDDSILVNPSTSAASTQYGSFRISECSSTVIACTTALNKTITNLDRTFNQNTDWNTPSNWLQGTVPTSANCVNIPSGKSVAVNIPVAAAKSITVANGGQLTINPDQTLTIEDGLVNNNVATNVDFVTVKSDGNLIQVNSSKIINSGPITAERKVTGLRYNPGTGAGFAVDYVYWSSPVLGQKTKNTAGMSDGFSPYTSNAFFYDYRESNDRFYQTADATFTPGKGYAVRAEENKGTTPYNKTFTFKGTVNNGDFNVPIIRSANTGVGGVDVHGYNMIGNPYPSNIDFKKLYADNSGLIYNTAYFWTNASYQQYQGGSGYSGNNYAVYNGTGGNPSTSPTGYTIPNGIIKVGQGFLVQSKGAVGSNVNLQFKNTSRVSTAGNFYQKDAVAKNRFTLQLTSPDQLVNSQLIGYVEGATDGYEQDYDAEAFDLSSNLFYSTLTDKRLLIQGRSASFTTQDKVNLGVNFFQNGTYTISLAHNEGIFSDAQSIYLKDKLNNTVTNLNQGSYSFTSTAGENTGRFEIIYQPESVLATAASSKEELLVYKDSGNFVVKAQSKKITDLQVFDMNGRLIYSVKPNAIKVTVVAAQLVNGTYLLKIDQSGKLSTKKVIR